MSDECEITLNIDGPVKARIVQYGRSPYDGYDALIRARAWELRFSASDLDGIEAIVDGLTHDLMVLKAQEAKQQSAMDRVDDLMAAVEAKGLR